MQLRAKSSQSTHVGKIMINAKKIEEIAKQVSESIPPGLKSMANEFEDKAKTVLQSKLAQLDVVTREEFDVQTQVLIKTRAKLSELEAKFTELEAKITENNHSVD
ncbi:accessory factor UbiK family protein [Colwellia asteriadis]|uniref:Ubiquinone biosynthesis accessory factor UbiK n=2 Tax=Colwellia asteriadis TaxID=517723 RepID=A0ABN1LCC7_9GAMM